MSVTIPALHPSLALLIQRSVDRKWVSYEELNTSLPDEMVDPDSLDEMIVIMEALGVEFVDQETVRLKNLDTVLAPLQTNLKFKRDVPSRIGEEEPAASNDQ